jgi:large subunit ribosomal protein L4e
MAARPQVSVAGGSQLPMPDVFTAPIRPDIVGFVHTNMRKNSRQAYAVKDMAGHGHSAHSWGTGRAVSRIPRVSGGGTSRAGQAAFGNMCRKGRMFAPTKTWRKWHRKINTNQKRYAVASALAASALPSLVMARGHKIDDVAEIPCVVSTDIESIQRTKEAVKALEAAGAHADAEKARNSKKLRRGKGKLRDRRHTQRLGPLVVYASDDGITQAFRNLPGVETASVDDLNLLQLAPGGHMGRFIIWTQAAFEKLDSIYGSTTRVSEVKSGYTLPRNSMTNSDITRLINSDEVQSVVRPAQTRLLRARRKKNPLKNLGVKVRLNPYALNLRRMELLAQEKRAANRAEAVAAKRAETAAKRKAHKSKTANYNRIVAEDTCASGSSGKKIFAGVDASKHGADEYKTYDNDEGLNAKCPSLDTLQFINDDEYAKPQPGQVTVLLLWGKYHKPGYNFMPLYSQLQAKYGDQVCVMGVSEDPEISYPKKFLNDPDGKYAKGPFTTEFLQAWDANKIVMGQLKSLFDLMSVPIPMAVVVDGTGTIRWYQNHSELGAEAPSYMDIMEDQVDAILSGQPLKKVGQRPGTNVEVVEESAGDVDLDDLF